MKKIVIIGFGYVGKAIHNFLKDHYDVLIYDPSYNESVTIDEVNNCDVAIVCVPTPMGKNNECDLTHVHETFKWLNTDLIILKSTVEIGTTSKLISMHPSLNIVFSPEFAGESTYWSEYKFHNSVVETPWFIFGGEPNNTKKAVELYMKVGGPTKKYLQCTTDEAEMTKYLTNTFYAMKVLFCYEMNEICEASNIDYNKVRELWLNDPRVSPMHTSVFSDNNYPFSGKCFPKDVNALNEYSNKVGYDSKLINEITKSNERIHDVRKERNNEK